MANEGKRDYNFYKGMYGFSKSQTDDFYENWKGKRGLRAFMKSNNIKTGIVPFLKKKISSSRRSKHKSLYKNN